jgi:RHS repeat-associated protein
MFMILIFVLLWIQSCFLSANAIQFNQNELAPIHLDLQDRRVSLGRADGTFEWRFDDRNRPVDLYKNGNLLYSYVYDIDGYDLVIHSNDFIYWFKSEDNILYYGDLISGFSGKRVFDEHNKCQEEHFFNSCSLKIEQGVAVNKYIVNEESQFSLISNHDQYEVLRNEERFSFLKSVPDGHILGYDESMNVQDFVVLGSHHHIEYDHMHAITAEKINSVLFSFAEKSDNTYFEEVKTDAFNRITKIVYGKETFLFSYDPFDRLMQIITSQGVFAFIYDGYDEVGCLVNGVLKEFRLIDGETVYFYKDGKDYAVRSDIWGNVCSVYDLLTQEEVETIEYNAFRELDSKSFISPWRFQSKRYLNDLKISLFPMRMYSCEKRCFMTQDPLGIDGSLDLMHYCLNNPYKYKDLLGTKIEFRLTKFEKNMVGEILDFLGTHFPMPLDFGMKFREYAASIRGLDPPEPFEDDQILTYGDHLGEDNLVIVFINGICTPKPIAENACYELAALLNQKIHCVHLATKGFGRDVFYAGLELLSFKTHGSKLIEQYLTQLLQDPLKKVIVILHSRGALSTALAIKDMPLEHRMRIDIYSFGAAWLFPRGVVNKAVNYVSYADPIPIIIDWKGSLGSGKFKNAEVIYLSPEEGCMKIFDHAFSGPTYQKALEELVKEFLKNYPREHVP